MNNNTQYDTTHSSLRSAANQWPAVLVLVGVCSTVAAGQPAEPRGDGALRKELTTLLHSAGPEAAIQRVQQALDRAPESAGVRHEYLTLHLSLARTWYAQENYDACLAALRAILAVEPGHAEATRMQAEIDAARGRAAAAAAEIGLLIRLELFETALDQIHDIRALRPDLVDGLTSAERAAWLGAADDHYLARNFNEALALYENFLSNTPAAPADVYARWVVSLTLAVTESDFSRPISAETAARLLNRAEDALARMREPVLGGILRGLLAERANHLLEAGRAYAAALGVAWEMPPVDQRRGAVTGLRRKAIERARAFYESTPTRRRDGPWSLALPGVWKRRQTAHFAVYARNDLVAARVAEALEYHFTGIARWIGRTPDASWEPRCEIRVHYRMTDLHEATGTSGVTRAVSHTRLQAGRVLSRKIEVFQTNPWLLSSTLPHELAHILLAEAASNGKLPLAVDEGLALQTEPPARRLQFRRLLERATPNASNILMTAQLPADPLPFYARCDALTDLLLGVAARVPHTRGGAKAGDGTAVLERTPVASLLDRFGVGYSADWWKNFGWDSRAEMRAAWRGWHAARRRPARMPLMILSEPSSRPAGRGR